MKEYIHQVLRFGTGLLTLVFAFTACNDKNDLGLELLPGEDLINVKSVVVKDDISAYTFTEDGITTSGHSTNLLGSINDPVFGNTTMSFASQFRLTSYPAFGENPVADSTFLVLYYRVIYGDTLTAQNIKVYELEESLNPDIEYTQETDVKTMVSTTPVGELTFTPKVELDSTTADTLYQYLKIPIDNELGNRIVKSDSADLATNEAFLNILKGLYVEAQKLTTSASGTLLSIETVPTSDFNGSVLAVYYNNDANRHKYEVDSLTPDTLSRVFRITQYSARISNITHDYSGTAFENVLNQEEEQQAKIYIQPTGGLKSKIYIDDLSHWKDSANTAINKAELVFQIDTITSNTDKYRPPLRLLLTYIDKKGEERLPVDATDFSSVYYDGYLRSDYTYHFNITQHLQRIIDITNPDDEDYVGNQGFYLTTGQRTDMGNRVVLEGANQPDGIKLVITYSKYWQ
ncbi:MAG: DUF4270 domain-containing protein [Draconibacterium sp.]